MKFEEKISLNPRFTRSINLNADILKINILSNFICAPSLETTLRSMCEHISLSSQSAFMWTGPYGSGKSSLAVFLAALASGKSHKKVYKLAFSKLDMFQKEIGKIFSRDFSRVVIPVIGTNEDPSISIANALGVQKKSEFILEKLKDLSQQKNGVILVVDEMGKFLERAFSDPSSDMYIFQELAELANRSNGKIIFIGILHQSFTDYSRNLSKRYRDEWNKIQGRFIDFSIDSSGEEQIYLISNAIKSESKPKEIREEAKILSETVAINKFVDKGLISKALNECWPLHPVVTILLGAVSKQGFGQNQRSVFSFLCSVELFGFQYFLKEEDFDQNKYYNPELFWIYLETNLSSSIAASHISKMWITAIDAINRTSISAHSPIAVSVLRVISLINIFKGGTGLSATRAVLQTVFNNEEELGKAIKELEGLSVIRYKKHNTSYSLFEGSDFDIEKELKNAYKHVKEIDFSLLNDLASFSPVIAKKHYHQTGSIRWMDINLVSEEQKFETASTHKKTNAFGDFIVIVPLNKDSEAEIKNKLQKSSKKYKFPPKVIGVLNEYIEILEYSRELKSLEWIKENVGEISSDRIARKEIDSRHSIIAFRLKTQLETSLNNISWVYQGNLVDCMKGKQISSFTSYLAGKVFNMEPIIKSEMLNRNKPSRNANAAVKALLKRMVNNNGEEKLGIEGFPAEGGLFKILLEKTSLYGQKQKEWKFATPGTKNFKLKSLWEFTSKLLSKESGNIKFIFIIFIVHFILLVVTPPKPSIPFDIVMLAIKGAQTTTFLLFIYILYELSSELFGLKEKIQKNKGNKK